MEFDPKLSKQAKERINSKQNWGDTDAGEHVWPYFIYVYLYCFLRKKIGCKEKDSYPSIEKKKKKNHVKLYDII